MKTKQRKRNGYVLLWTCSHTYIPVFNRAKSLGRGFERLVLHNRKEPNV